MEMIVRRSQSLGNAIPARFWKYVYKTDSCWFWIGFTNEKGYGIFNFKQKTPLRRAHHVAWFFAHGVWPSYLMHTCDTPQCVNPDHLRESTNLENHQDSSRKGVNPNLERMNKQFCKWGHPRTETNLYTSKDGPRQCRVCAKLRARRRRENGNVCAARAIR